MKKFLFLLVLALCFNIAKAQKSSHVIMEIITYKPDKTDTMRYVLDKKYKSAKDSVIYFWYSAHQLQAESALQDYHYPIKRRSVKGKEFTLISKEKKPPTPDAILVYVYKRKS